MSDNEGDEEAAHVPLHRLQAFGSGLKRKHIRFVPETSPSATPIKRRKSNDASDLYLSIVLPSPKAESRRQSSPSFKNVNEKEPVQQKPSAHSDSTKAEGFEGPEKRSQTLICPICNGMIHEGSQPGSHEATLSHQLALEHSYPPSSLDRQRKGLSMMESYGWDPDSRQGLGFRGEGRLFPVSAVSRGDNRGIGAPKESGATKLAVQKNDPISIKEKHKAEQAKDQKMRELFYRDEKTNEYLGVGI